MIERESTVLPEPDSPTMPRVCAALERERHAVDRAHDAPVGREVVATSSTSSSGTQGRAGSSTGAECRSQAALPHVEPAADDVAEHVQREHGEEDHDRGLEHDVRRSSMQVVAADGDHVAPRGVSGSTLAPRMRQRALGDDRDRDAEQRDRDTSRGARWAAPRGTGCGRASAPWRRGRRARTRAPTTTACSRA